MRCCNTKYSISKKCFPSSWVQFKIRGFNCSNNISLQSTREQTYIDHLLSWFKRASVTGCQRLVRTKNKKMSDFICNFNDHLSSLFLITKYISKRGSFAMHCRSHAFKTCFLFKKLSCHIQGKKQHISDCNHKCIHWEREKQVVFKWVVNKRWLKRRTWSVYIYLALIITAVPSLKPVIEWKCEIVKVFFLFC